jgi:hypothetical protein
MVELGLLVMWPLDALGSLRRHLIKLDALGEYKHEVQGKDIVFRFIIEYSSLMDFGPY